MNVLAETSDKVRSPVLKILTNPSVNEKSGTVQLAEPSFGSVLEIKFQVTPLLVEYSSLTVDE